MTLPKRKLGRNGPEVSAIGFGAMGFSAYYTTGQTTDEEAFKVFDRALDLGCTFWDTSDTYLGNETLIGKYFKKSGRRNEVFLATKFAGVTDENGNRSICGKPEYVLQACEKSLKALGVETIDLYYIHRVDPTVPIEHTIGALVQLYKQGKIRYIGISECSAKSLRRAHAIHPISAVQMEYSPFALDIESAETGPFLDTARELGVAIVPYSPLGRGVLTGEYKSRNDFKEDDARRQWLPRFSPENFDKNLVLVDQLKKLAKKKGVTPGQMSLAWILAQGEDFIPIPGTKRIQYLEENIASIDVKLTEEEMNTIRKYSEAAEVSGARYPAALMPFCDGDTPELPTA